VSLLLCPSWGLASLLSDYFVGPAEEILMRLNYNSIANQVADGFDSEQVRNVFWENAYYEGLAPTKVAMPCGRRELRCTGLLLLLRSDSRRV
jgi:hypothetical protein